MKGYRFERISQENLVALIVLYKRCFKQRVNQTFLQKKYNTSGFGAAYVGYLAFDEEDQSPAAYYGVFPIILDSSKGRVLAAQSGDTMTDPKHQGKGLFVKLAQLTYELAKQNGIKLVFGFPNQNSYPGFVKKLNWQHVSDVRTYVIKTGAFPFDKIAKKISWLQPLYQWYVKRILKKYPTIGPLANSAAGQVPDHFVVVHDAAFFDYKTYFRHYRINYNGVRCILKFDGRLWLGDTDSIEKGPFIRFITDLKRLAKKTGCSSIHFSVSENLVYNACLKDLTDQVNLNPVGVLVLDESIASAQFEFVSIDFDTY